MVSWHRLSRRVLQGGFTLIELLVVMAIIAMLLTVALPRYMKSVEVARDTTLAESLRATRETIDKYYGDTGQYPDSLEQLVRKGYLKAIPEDPVTQSTQTWIIVPPPGSAKPGIYSIRSGAKGDNRLGQPYGEM